MKYSIIKRTNGHIASRSAIFKGRTELVLYSNLTLREAQKTLVELYNKEYDTCHTTWGTIRRSNPFLTATFTDGTRSYEYDSKFTHIVPDNEIHYTH